MSISSTWKDTIHNPLKDQWRSFTGQKQADKLARDQMEMQTQFAKMGIQWKVQDAIAAGIHPLAALGAQTHSPTPVSSGQKVNSGMQGIAALTGIIGAISGLVTNIKGQTAPSNPMNQSHDQFGVNVSAMKPGPNGGYIDVPTPSSDYLGVQKNVAPLEQYFINKEGYLQSLPSQGATESLESSFIDAWRYGIGKAIQEVKNATLYSFSTTSNYTKNKIRKARPPFKEKGFHLEFNPTKGWKVVPNSKGFNLYENRKIKAKW